MANKTALYSVGAVIAGIVAFIVNAIAVGLPYWGYFYNIALPDYDQGYFGPWQVCKRLHYNRENCGQDVAKFQPYSAVYIAGVASTIGTALLGVFCLLSVIQLAMISSKEQVVLKYTHAVMLKVALSLAAALLSIAASGLFAVQLVDRNARGFHIDAGEAFYVLIASIVANILLFTVALYDALHTRRSGGDPTAVPHDTTINNPGFRDARTGVSMTDASGKPYSTNGHGSVVSMNTTATTLTGMSSDGSTITRSPLRSSLKKPRVRDGGTLGIPNPGYSGNSPPLGRNGSQKKVRIQTHSTEV